MHVSEQHWQFTADKPHHLGKCAPRLAEELSKETSVTVAQAYEVLEDLARRYPELIMIRTPMTPALAEKA